MTESRLTGAKAMVKSLESQGVEVIFGLPGGAALPIYDELPKSKIKHILTRHEQGAAHMADGYARASGKVGVCLATSGPGATNLVTGLATAYMDSSAVVAITGQVPRSMIGNDAFQEVDITGITIPITKHNYLVKEAADLPHIIEQAFFLASTGRKGPVLIDIPRDVQLEDFSPDRVKRAPLEGYNPTIEGHPRQITKAAQLVKSAQKPLLITGGGVFHSDSSEDLQNLAEKADIPVVNTLTGKSTFPNSHELYFGMLGYHGRVVANSAVSEADVIVAVGVRFGDRTTGPLATFAKQAKLIHIDIDPAEISKNVPSYLPIVGDAKNILSQLGELLPEMKHRDWISHLKEISKAHPLPAKMVGVSTPNILRILQEIVKDPVFVTDVGKHQMFAAHYISVESPRSFITSGGLGTMGFGVPAAIGVKVARPDRTVIDIAGDGSFMMTCNQIATAVQYNIPICVLIMNDYCLGMIHQLQDVFYGKRYEACNFDKNVDYAKLAESMGAVGIRVTEEKQIKGAIEKGLSCGKPCVVDFVLEDNSNVYPMVTGSSLLEYRE